MNLTMNAPLLNEQQENAVKHLDGPLLVLAGAGSGKTRVVTYRIAELIHYGIAPENILALTFTNKAAAEMKGRVHTLTHAAVLISTFHSLGARILRESIHHLGYTQDFVIYDEEDSLKLLRTCMKRMNISDKNITPKTLKNLISHAKNNLEEPLTAARDATAAEQVLPDIYCMYQDSLKAANAVDFDDLLLLPTQLFKTCAAVLQQYQNRWKYVLVDEYQDTNIVQYTFTKLLVEKSQNIFVVGDPDQSIYSWRGANIKNILNFEEDWPNAKVIKLEQNYRSTCNILNAANALIRNNQSRYEKKLWSALGEGEKIVFNQCNNEREESSFVINQIAEHQKQENLSLNSFVIFYRTNAQSRPLEDALLSKNLPYIVIGGISFYHRREIKDILAFLKMIHMSYDIISFARTINIPKRGLGDTSILKLSEGARASGLGFVEYIFELLEGKRECNLRLTKKQRDGLVAYFELMQTLRDMSENASLEELVSETIRLTGYLDHLKVEPDTFEDRKANLDELISKAAEWETESSEPSLSSFLEELSLKTNLDESRDEQEKISLMTVHNGKGLEYDITFLVGMEEMLFPHINAKDSLDGIEEERRLCYVGMTRARKKLYLTAAKSRFMWGSVRFMRPSRFLKEIPSQYITKTSPSKTTGNSFQNNIDDHSDDLPASDDLQKGDMVFHSRFGVGNITDTGSCSMGPTYTVFFQQENEAKTLVGKYAKLKKL